MKTSRDLAAASWTLAGFIPDTWRTYASMETGIVIISETVPIPARVPASVQQLLLEQASFPTGTTTWTAARPSGSNTATGSSPPPCPRRWFAAGPVRRLRCAGLDAAGWVCCNGRLIGRFDNGFTEHVFDLSAVPPAAEYALQIIFDLPPRWLGQFNHTSQIKDWKARFNYTWDWQPRVVQIGIWDRITLEVGDGAGTRGHALRRSRRGLHALRLGPRRGRGAADGRRPLPARSQGRGRAARRRRHVRPPAGRGLVAQPRGPAENLPPLSPTRSATIRHVIQCVTMRIGRR
jgi:hypothetical protein